MSVNSANQRAFTTLSGIPYFSQWEDPDCAAGIIAGELELSDIKLWAQSGASTQQEFIEWANHVCGMCCLKMVLAAVSGKVVPVLNLTQRSLPYGAYVREGENIKGLIYAPFVEYVRQELELTAVIKVDILAEDIAAQLVDHRFFIASVHPSIRIPETVPPRKGGHLVLVTHADREFVTFHNPSGHDIYTQQDVTLPVEVFARFFAGRGISLVENAD
ncbi:hypothetical protein [Rahnella aquatilis]|uniref:Peptidase C39-like domain-containing protein n=1 Tax=Rahnella aquatilis (strain ATCC 33071 / DSM 4594 / JCM 1683 / NBRC 105701 / NCIMB 13365 / CIP 78.65) TaxID=745277 RepID=H2ITD2_RAHAC|nr:hypothetical protein [Rahnella aquatilis]AEX52716.1 hypothetical protein Rahaq2_2887 [Rahnella aquatilis CIP 78.65 = ATCC 33071]KFD05269.1 hypothetical protein GRAQ_01928 [Rahnella aquatilis CIP 78.65 = ATCC 33071]